MRQWIAAYAEFHSQRRLPFVDLHFFSCDGRRYTTKRGRLFQEFDIFCSAKRECFFPSYFDSNGDAMKIYSANSSTHFARLSFLVHFCLFGDFEEVTKSFDHLALSAFVYCVLLKSHKIRRRRCLLSAQANYEKKKTDGAFTKGEFRKDVRAETSKRFCHFSGKITVKKDDLSKQPQVVGDFPT